MEFEDYYEFLEILPSSSITQIKKAYRKKALILHPDKNLDNPSAKKDFEKLSKILDVLTDPAAKEEYDQRLKARKEKKIRDAELDVKRRKLKEDLEERELRAKEEREKKIVENLHKQREVERTRLINIKLLEEENDKLRKIVERNLIDISNKIGPRNEALYKVKIEWDPRIKYNLVLLTNIFSKYGEMTVSNIAKSSNSALIEFKTKDAVMQALAAKYENISIKGLQVAVKEKSGAEPFKSPFGIKPSQSLDDFEREVLEKLRVAQQYRNLGHHPSVPRY